MKVLYKSDDKEKTQLEKWMLLERKAKQGPPLKAPLKGLEEII